jgi:hypothetical protein
MSLSSVKPDRLLGSRLDPIHQIVVAARMMAAPGGVAVRTSKRRTTAVEYTSVIIIQLSLK